MRRRPQPNPRRGLLRAALAVVVLTAILVAALLVVSSLTAPSVNAPAATPTPGTIMPPSTPGPVTPGKNATPAATPAATKASTPAATPGATPAATKKVKKDVALAPATFSQAERITSGVTLARQRVLAVYHRSAYFAGKGDAYRGSVLFVRDGRLAHPLRVGEADPYVRPVWSENHRYLLFARVRESRQYPGAVWTLLRFDTTSRHTIVLARSAAMGLIPLGWQHGRALYVLSRTSDSSIYSASSAHQNFISILASQPVDAASLSPDSQRIVFATPSDCIWCTMTVFDIDHLSTWHGPSGIPDQRDFAWTADSSHVVTAMRGRLAAIDSSSHSIAWYSWPKGLAPAWTRTLTATETGKRLRLVDDSSGVSFGASISGI